MICSSEVTPLHRPLEAWAGIIQADLVRSVEGLLAAGQHLCEARQQHPERDFVKWLDTAECGVSRPSAYRLMEIAERALSLENVLRSENIMSQLPAVPSTLAEVFHLDPPALSQAVAEGKVRPDMTRDEAQALTEGTKRVRVNHSPEVKEAALNLIEDGMTQVEVADQMHIPRATVQGWWRRHRDQDRVTATPAQLTRMITETANTLDALVSSVSLVDTRNITPEPDTWPCLDSITESLKRLTRFARELNHARDH